MMNGFYSQLVEILRAGEQAAVATVVATRGSAPREVGAKMLVRSSGSLLGTIGGGCGEAQVWRTALQVLETGEPALELVDLTEEISMDSASVCGGTMEVLVERWSPASGEETRDDVALADAILERYGRRLPVVLATVMAAPPRASCTPGQRVLLDQGSVVLGGLGSRVLDEALLSAAANTKEGETARVVTLSQLTDAHPGELPGSVRLYLEVVKPHPRLVVLGAGHIAVPLSKMAKLLDFDVAVLDDRSSFANAERFPEASSVLAAEFAEGIRQLAVDRDSYVVLITRGHQHDVECLRELVEAETECAYLGMIGSQRRVQAVFELLGQQGVSAAKLAQVHAPIGIDIRAKTPAEIALSIMAEIVNIRRGGRAVSLSERDNRI